MSLPYPNDDTNVIPHQVKVDEKQVIEKRKGFIRGILLTLVLALLGSLIAELPFFSIMGIMIISIILGMSWKAIMEIPTNAESGITFSSKVLLRAGIILLGIRLNFQQIIDTGMSIILIDAIVIIFTIVVITYLGKLFSLDKYLTTLIAVGTAVCGAAAIVAIAPVIKAKKEFVALSVAIIAILGTIGTIIYTFLYPILGMDSYLYGVLVGSTLHELAHVVAAAIPSGDIGSETAILVKLGRVALLIPVAFVIGMIFTKQNKHFKKQTKSLKELPIPWFIFGFLGVSLINTFVPFPTALIDFIVGVSVFLMSMAMAGLGLGINIAEFKKAGMKPVLVGILGFAALATLGPFLLYLL